jgi:hypothetical protein
MYNDEPDGTFETSIPNKQTNFAKQHNQFFATINL